MENSIIFEGVNLSELEAMESSHFTTALCLNDDVSPALESMDDFKKSARKAWQTIKDNAGKLIKKLLTTIQTVMLKWNLKRLEKSVRIEGDTDSFLILTRHMKAIGEVYKEIQRKTKSSLSDIAESFSAGGGGQTISGSFESVTSPYKNRIVELINEAKAEYAKLGGGVGIFSKYRSAGFSIITWKDIKTVYLKPIIELGYRFSNECIKHVKYVDGKMIHEYEQDVYSDKADSNLLKRAGSVIMRVLHRISNVFEAMNQTFFGPIRYIRMVVDHPAHREKVYDDKVKKNHK